MSVTEGLTIFLNLQVLIAVAGGALVARARWFPRRQSFARELQAHYLTLAAVLALAFVLPVWEGPRLVPPPVHIWSAPAGKLATAETSRPVVSVAGSSATLELGSLKGLLGALAALTITVGAWILLRDHVRLSRIRRGAHRLRRIGAVSILVSDRVTVPFACWWRGRAEVYVPPRTLAAPGDLALTVGHELQHHRQRDTLWIHLIRAVQWVSWPNPVFHLWRRTIEELQEFACDERLLGRPGLEPRDYARLLVETAERALFTESRPGCAAGMAFPGRAPLLKRRIIHMLNEKNPESSKKNRPFLAAALALVFAGSTAFASRHWVQDRRISMEQAQTMLKKNPDREFPVDLNEHVLRQLNVYLGTPQGREFMRQGLQRMKAYQGLILKKIEKHGAPVELMAIPLIESGYQNLPDRNAQGWGAGLWMFIASTARAFGLRVDDEVDERLNVDLLSDAAMKYLMMNKIRFDDWRLSAMAYNMGENALQKAITATGTRDPWALIHKGHENDKNYLAKVMAAILILDNPESVR